MFWFLIALLARLAFAFCNILDGHFRVDVFKDSFSQTFFFALYLALILIAYLCFFPIELLSLDNLVLAAITGVTLSLHAIPYLSALKTFETSVVVSLFTLGRILIPIMAFVFVGEQLSMNEVIGFIVILIGALWHAYKPVEMKLDRGLLLKMSFSGLMLALFSVCSKKLFFEVQIDQALFYIYLFDMLFGLSLILVPTLRPNIIDAIKNSKTIIVPYSATVVTAMLGHSLSFYAISLTKVTYVTMTAQFQAPLALLISYLGKNLVFFKHNESMSREDMSRKLIGFVVMAFGMALALFF